MNTPFDHNEYYLLETIEAYLLKTLDDKARTDFERKMKEDESVFKFFKEYENLFQQLKFKYKQEDFLKYLHSKKNHSKHFVIKISDIVKQKNFQIQYFVFRNKTALVAASVLCVFVSLAAYLLSLVFNHSNQLIELKRNVANSIYKLEKKIDTKKSSTNNDKIDNVGTGFLVDNDGYILTNSHILNDAKKIYVESLDGVSYKIEVVFTDPSIDLALLKIDDSNFYKKEKIPYSISNRKIDLGESIFTLGYPKEDIVYGEGYLSSLTGYNSDSTALQMDISLNPGNSGGPIFDSYGNVIGMVRNKQKEVEGVSFAIKSDLIIKTIKQLKFNDVTKSFKDLQLNYNLSHSSYDKLHRIKKYQQFIYIVKSYS